MTKLQLKFMLLVVWYIKGKSVPKTERHEYALILKDSSYTNNDTFNCRKGLKSLRVMLMTPDIER